MQTKRKTGSGNKTRISLIIVFNILIWFGNYGTLWIFLRESPEVGAEVAHWNSL